MRSKLIFLLFFIALASSLSLSYYRFIKKGDYFVYSKITCNPEKDNCFVHECTQDDIRCGGDYLWNYKIVFQKAYRLPSFECSVGATDCKVLFCSEGTIKDLDLGDLCSK